MSKCIVVGIDAPLSPATRETIRTVKEIIGPTVQDLRLVLLHVMPLAYISSMNLSAYAGQLSLPTVAHEQRQEVEKVLTTVRQELQEQAQRALRIDMCIRQGSPAEEIVRLAEEVHADIVIVGSRGNRPGARVRRLLLGSKSHRVLQKAHCPVMIVSSSPARFPRDLVAWYGQAITHYLSESPRGLTVFTPGEVAQLFAPPCLEKKPGRKERAAAILALEQLAGEGILCRHDIQGEMRYVND